jgi:PST family polysaccharide transporter
MDNVLIGRYLGSDALGLYSKAYQLLMMPITNLRNPLTRVAIPSLSRLQEDPEQYHDYFLKCVSLLAFLSMPVVAFMFVFSDQLIRLLLGPQWVGASEIFKILALAAFIQPVASTNEMMLISSGQGRLLLRLSVITAVVTCLSFAIGLPWGAKGVAAAYAMANYLLFFPIFYYSLKNTDITLVHMAESIYKPIFSSLLTGGGCVLIVPFMNDLNLLLWLPASLFFFASVYLICFALFPGGMAELRQTWTYGKLIFERNK